MGMRKDSIGVVRTIINEYRKLLYIEDDSDRTENVKCLLSIIFAPIYRFEMTTQNKDKIVEEYRPHGLGKFLDMWNVFFDGLLDTKEHLGCNLLEPYSPDSQYFVPTRVIPKLDDNKKKDEAKKHTLESHFKSLGIFVFLTVVNQMINFPNIGNLHDATTALDKIFIGKFPPFFIRFLLHRGIGKGHWWYRYSRASDTLPATLDGALLYADLMDMPDLVNMYFPY